MTTNTHTLQIEEILELLPHRFPFLLVDRVLDFEEGRFLRAVKNVSVNEPFFQGHFPGKPIFPGVLILEAMAQATGILAFKSVGKLEPGELYYFAGIDEARFKRPVVPGDQMINPPLCIQPPLWKRARRLARTHTLVLFVSLDPMSKLVRVPY